MTAISLTVVLSVVVALFSNVALACVSGSCKNGMCSDIPSNNQYYLTSFCDSSVACGSFSGNCNEYYAADYSRFGCNSVISCCKGSDCLNLKVIDGGPGCSVEDSAHKQVVDASYSTCKHFTGSTSCGWSDKITVTCKKTSYTGEDLIPGSFESESKVAGYGVVTDATKHATSNIGSVSAYRGLIPIGPCSYNGTYAQENNRPICGYDYDLHFQPDTSIKRVTTEVEQYEPHTPAAATAAATASVAATTQAAKAAAKTEHNMNATLGYNGNAAVNWGNSYCGSHSEWLCAEFVARALNQGGMFPGVTDYGNYNGYNLRYVPDLHRALVHYGWSASSSGQWCGSAGQVLIYNGDEHAALAIGNCLLDQHNPARCGSGSQWGTNIVLKP